MAAGTTRSTHAAPRSCGAVDAQVPPERPGRADLGGTRDRHRKALAAGLDNRDRHAAGHAHRRGRAPRSIPRTARIAESAHVDIEIWAGSRRDTSGAMAELEERRRGRFRPYVLRAAIETSTRPRRDPARRMGEEARLGTARGGARESDALTLPRSGPRPSRRDQHGHAAIPPSRPVDAELEAGSRAARAREATGVAAVVHVSRGRARRPGRQRPARGARVSCETDRHPS